MNPLPLLLLLGGGLWLFGRQRNGYATGFRGDLQVLPEGPGTVPGPDAQLVETNSLSFLLGGGPQGLVYKIWLDPAPGGKVQWHATIRGANGDLLWHEASAPFESGDPLGVIGDTMGEIAERTARREELIDRLKTAGRAIGQQLGG